MSAESFNRAQLQAGKLTWAMVTEMAKCWQEKQGLLVDGFIGDDETIPSLLAALEPDDPHGIAPAAWAPWDGPLVHQPRTRTEVYGMFGNPGSGAVSQKWKRNNIAELHGSSRLPGVPAKWYVKLHKLIEPYAREGLRRATLSSDYEIDRFGGFVFRHQRHRSSRPLSYHSWGIAFDVDASRNKARSFKIGTKPEPWSDEWMQLWPHGVDKAFVDAFVSCGFRWGGNWSTFVDPMHFEWLGVQKV